MHVCEHESELGWGKGGLASMRFKEWFWRCMSMCLCSLTFAASEASALFVASPFASDDAFFLSKKCEATGRQEEGEGRSTGVKWRLKFQWQRGRNPP